MILLELFWVFARIGALTFGGGYAMVSLIERELADRGWIAAVEFADIVAVSQMTPGPLALNVATYVGRQTAGLAGALSASLGLTLPAVLITGVALWVLRHSGTKWTARAAARGIRAAVLGLIGSAVLFFLESSVIRGLPGEQPAGDTGFRDSLHFSPAAALVFGLTLLAVKRFRLKPIPVILLAALLGCAAGLAEWL